MQLQGKVAIVTGGAVRIGRALSLALADAGMDVVVHHFHSEEQAQETVDEILSRGRQSIAVSADLGDPVPAAQQVLAAALERFGHVDVLVNSAAIFGAGTLASTSADDWEKHFAINLKAPCFLCREFALRHTPGSCAHIVNIADWRGLRPVPGHLAYTLTKAGLLAMTAILAQELAPDIRVNAVAPGAILPPAGASGDYMRRIAEDVPLGKTGTVNDVAAAVLYLLKSDFVTGDVISVTGGEHLP